jgi:hypothetical protein
MESAFCSGCGGPPDDSEVVGFFTLASPASIGQVHWVTGTQDTPTDNSGLSEAISVRIWNVDSGGNLTGIQSAQTVTPGLISKQSFSISQGGQTFPFYTWILSADLVGLSLTDGTYGISFYADNLGIPGFSGGNGAVQLQHQGCLTGPDCTYSPLFNNESMGFALFAGEAATPLPTALPLFATGLGGLGLLGWRRKRKARAGA